MLMGLLDFLLFGAFMNILRDNQKDSSHSDYSTNDYDREYKDGYDDDYMDYDDYQFHDDYNCVDSSDDDCDCDDFFDF